jgi:hydroxyacylglutathione hydrolase
MPTLWSTGDSKGAYLGILEVTAVPAFDDNYLWLIHSPLARDRVVAVDPGDATAVRKTLQLAQLKLSGILITHHHADHVGGVTALLEDQPVPVFGPENEPIPGEPRRVKQNEHVRFAELGLDFEVFEVPGHTAGHLAYVGHGAVFCGDTLFSGGCGRLFEGTPAQMLTSLQKLVALPIETKVYCAHEYTLSNLRFARAVEPENEAVTAYQTACLELRGQNRSTIPSSIGLELRINPFLRTSAGTVKRAAEHHAGRTLDSESDIFAVLREWKNHFRG